MARISFTVRNASMILIVVTIFVYFLQLFIPGFTQFFLLNSAEILHHPWTLITSMFLHGSFTHILFNMYALFIFGPLVEQRIGSKRFLGLYFLAGIVGSLAFVLFEPTSLALGASGAIMGLLGVVIMILPNLRVLLFFVIPMSMRTAGILFALFDLVGFVGGETGIAHVAHLGGLTVGLLYGWYLLSRKKSFTAKFTARQSAHPKQTFARKPSKDYEKTIELTKDEMDDYFKYGKI